MEESYIDCECHGRSTTAIVCCHLVESHKEPAGFIENTDDPEDLQAWCNACESLYNVELELTEKFIAFNDFVVVCSQCYQENKVKDSTAI